MKVKITTQPFFRLTCIYYYLQILRFLERKIRKKKVHGFVTDKGNGDQKMGSGVWGLLLNILPLLIGHASHSVDLIMPKVSY